jgi:putative ABC transport system permease protein
MLLAVIGALIGAAIAWALYDGRRDALGTIIFTLTVPPAMVGVGVLWAVILALLGGLPPALGAARRPIAEALRAT